MAIPEESGVGRDLRGHVSLPTGMRAAVVVRPPRILIMALGLGPRGSSAHETKSNPGRPTPSTRRTACRWRGDSRHRRDPRRAIDRQAAYYASEMEEEELKDILVGHTQGAGWDSPRAAGRDASSRKRPNAFFFGAGAAGYRRRWRRRSPCRGGRSRRRRRPWR